MLKDGNIFHGPSKIVGSMGPHRDNMVFLETSDNLTACHGPQFCVTPTTF